MKILFNFSFFVFKAKENIYRNSQFERSIWKIYRETERRVKGQFIQPLRAWVSSIDPRLKLKSAF